MDLEKLKDPIVIIHMIQTLVKESIEEGINTKDLDEEIGDFYDYWNLSIVRIYKLIESKLILLDSALINLKIQDESKYYKLGDIVINLDKEIEEYYTLKEQIAPYPTTVPQIIKKHVEDLKKFPNAAKKSNELNEDNEESEIEIKKQKDKVRLLHELGIIDQLEIKYPYIKGNGQRITKLIMHFLDIKETSLQPIINALIHNNESDKNFPHLKQTVKNVINKYTLEK